MRTFVISLPDARQRRLSAIRKLLPTGIPFEIVDGVEAKKMRSEFLPCAPEARHWLRVSEVGCYLAHLRAMQRIVDYDLPLACVLEDDFCFEPDPDWGLLQIRDHLPNDFRYVHLQRDVGINPKFRDIERVGGFCRTYETPCCTTGYIISRELAEYILQHESHCRLPIDHLFCEISHQGGFYRTYKPLIGIEAELGSEILNDRQLME